MITVRKEEIEFIKQEEIDKVQSTRCIVIRKYIQHEGYKIKKYEIELIKIKW